MKMLNLNMNTLTLTVVNITLCNRTKCSGYANLEKTGCN